ncbi:MAG: ABC-F family ATP-binding cassette domain-containing protein [Deltaproteobacteria bacterium]|nr:ABC-F family ATP-binding cassette domain-containing protein [Deltaproteobacteria bacterium]
MTKSCRCIYLSLLFCKNSSKQTGTDNENDKFQSHKFFKKHLHFYRKIHDHWSLSIATINLNQLSFEYDAPYVKIFEDLSLRIDTGWKTALIGRNGRGKTTLLNLLQKKISPTAGWLDVSIPTSYFPFIPENEYQNTLDVIRDCIAPFNLWEKAMGALWQDGHPNDVQKAAEINEHYEQFGGYEINARIEKEMAAIGLAADTLERNFTKLSGGEQTRALIIALFLRKGQFLLLDEPTNHLDMDGREALARYLFRKPGFLLVSHDRSFLDICTDHVIAINRKDVRVMRGNYSEWKRQNDLEEKSERRANEKLKREISHLEAAAGQRRAGAHQKEKEKIGAYDKGFVGHRAAKQMKRAIIMEKKIQENIEEKKELFKNLEKERQLKFGSADKTPEILLTVENLSIKFDGKMIIKDFSLSVGKGRRIAIIGGNGVGKTTLFNAISRETPIHSGTVHVPGNVKLMRAYQKPLWASGHLRPHLQMEKIDETRFRQILGVMGVSGDVFDRPLETFSQGQLKKVDLCRSFIHPAHLLLWDEPVNYVDVMSREQIEEAILVFKPNLLFTEHDKYFIDRIATDVVRLEPAEV